MDLFELENRFSYHPPKDTQPLKYAHIREIVHKVAAEFQHICPESRERSIAITKLEEAVMWANAAIARNSSNRK